MLKGWERKVGTGSDGYNAVPSGYVQGVRKRWMFREGVSKEERKLGYRILPDGDNPPDDEIDELI
jgi:hypothetical protein